MYAWCNIFQSHPISIIFIVKCHSAGLHLNNVYHGVSWCSSHQHSDIFQSHVLGLDPVHLLHSQLVPVDQIYNLSLAT